jgi:hypothetical protein
VSAFASTAAKIANNDSQHVARVRLLMKTLIEESKNQDDGVERKNTIDAVCARAEYFLILGEYSSVFPMRNGACKHARTELGFIPGSTTIPSDTPRVRSIRYL